MSVAQFKRLALDFDMTTTMKLRILRNLFFMAICGLMGLCHR